MCTKYLWRMHMGPPTPHNQITFLARHTCIYSGRIYDLGSILMNSLIHVSCIHAYCSTDIFGIQYVASKWLTEKWKIWVASGTAGVAEWIALPPSMWSLGTQPVLAADRWYKFTLDMDYDTLHYVSLTILDEAYGLVIDVANLTELVIAKEPRLWEHATVLTVEGENLYGNCGEHGPFESKLFYDKLMFQPIPAESDPFALSWGYEFTKHASNYTDAEVFSWDFDVYQGNFESSNNAYFMKDHAVVTNGQLVLTIDNATNLASPSRAYTSGGVHTATWANHSQTYGKWEVEAQFPVGFGVMGYIGLFRTDKTWSPAVDFAEVIGRHPSHLILTQHYANESGIVGGMSGHAQSNSTIDAAAIGEETWGHGFHVYGIEWTETELKYFVDGALVSNETVEFSPELMDVAVVTGTGDCGSWVDCPENAEVNGFAYPLPVQMKVNWIKVYEYTCPDTSMTTTTAPTAAPSKNGCIPVSYGWH